MTYFVENLEEESYSFSMNLQLIQREVCLFKDARVL